MKAYSVVRPKYCDAFIARLASELASAVSEAVGATVDIIADEDADDTLPGCLIAVGETSLPFSSRLLCELPAAGYGVRHYGRHIAVGGHTQTTVESAVHTYLPILTAENLDSLEFTGNYDEWLTDLPQFRAEKASGYSDMGHGYLLSLWRNASEAERHGYCHALETAGFSPYYTNSICDNTCSTYTSEHGTVHIYRTGYNNTVRIITSRKHELIPVGTPETEAVTAPSITQMRLDYAAGNFGMGYIITLSDGSFLVIDGGGAYGCDGERMWELLRKLNRRPDGRIVIAAWLLTHEHWDHYSVFNSVCLSHGAEFTVECFICNTPAPSVCFDSFDPNYYIASGFPAAAAAAGGIPIIRPHTLQAYYIRDARLETLFCQEDLYPEPLNIFNNSSVVTKITLGGEVILIPGDICNVPSEIICKMYGDYLKCDIIQVTHHGYNGATQEFYDLASPKLLLWPVEGVKQQRQCNNNSQKWFYCVNRRLCETHGADEILVADGTNKTITLHCCGVTKEFL